MSGPDLERELCEAAHAVTHAHLKQMVALGVGWPTIGELGRNHYGFGVARMCDAGDGLYHPGDDEPHLILPVFENGELVDLCAFRSDDPLNWLLRTGCGWALGLEWGLGRHTWGDPVPLAVSPLDWLRGGAEGLCILDWDAPEVHYLADLPHVVCSSPDLARRLRSALAKPVRFPEISVKETRLAA